jgi:hypothetical protein
MKPLLFLLFLCPFFSWGQGNTCNNPIVLNLNGICNTYSFTGTGNSAYCPPTGVVGKTLWLRFVATSTCLKLGLKTSSPTVLEVIPHTTACTPQYNSSAMCLFDGDGIWSPGVPFTSLVVGNTYNLKLWVEASFNGTIDICATPSGITIADCLIAKPFDNNGIEDDNSCYGTPQGLNPGAVCALSLENTAWYSYTVATTGTSAITISPINCDHQSNGSSAGFQIGFFTGTCIGPAANNNGLTSIYCEQGLGTFVTATAPALPVGTKVYVAIDGISGANCKYTIKGFNALPLSTRTEINVSPIREYNLHAIQNGFRLTNTRSIRTEIYVYDMGGRLITRIQTKNSITFGESLPRGVYHIKMNGVGKSYYKP